MKYSAPTIETHYALDLPPGQNLVGCARRNVLISGCRACTGIRFARAAGKPGSGKHENKSSSLITLPNPVVNLMLTASSQPNTRLIDNPSGRPRQSSTHTSY